MRLARLEDDRFSRTGELLRSSQPLVADAPLLDRQALLLRDAVTDWISEREGPVGKPPPPGHLVSPRSGLKVEPVDKTGWSASGF